MFLPASVQPIFLLLVMFQLEVFPRTGNPDRRCNVEIHDLQIGRADSIWFDAGIGSTGNGERKWGRWRNCCWGLFVDGVRFDNLLIRNETGSGFVDAVFCFRLDFGRGFRLCLIWITGGFVEVDFGSVGISEKEHCISKFCITLKKLLWKAELTSLTSFLHHPSKSAGSEGCRCVAANCQQETGALSRVYSHSRKVSL